MTNTRKKTKNKVINKTKKVTPDQYNIICKKSPTIYETFEDKVDALFKKNKMDVVSTSFNLEKQVVSDLKKAINLKNIKPQDNFYSYINELHN